MSLDNLEADFLSRQALVAWDFQTLVKFSTSVLSFSGHALTLNVFATSRTNLLPRYMTWERDESTVGQNCLNYLWDPVTWLFPPVPLLSAVLREVEEQQIEVIIICPLGTGSVVASSFQDVATAHLEASSLSSMPQLPRIYQIGRIQYGSIDGSPYQGRPVNEADNAVVLN